MPGYHSIQLYMWDCFVELLIGIIGTELTMRYRDSQSNPIPLLPVLDSMNLNEVLMVLCGLIHECLYVFQLSVMFVTVNIRNNNGQSNILFTSLCESLVCVIINNAHLKSNSFSY